jgi:DNA-binding NarL/FixJ family response regulator
MLVHGSADHGVSAALAAVRDIRVVGHASSHDDAVRLADRALPDVVLIDLSMLGFDGIETTRRLLASRGGLRVVMLSTAAEPSDVNVAVDAGAIGYLQTDAEPSEIAAAVRSAARGETPFSALAAKGLLIARAAPTLAARPSQPRPNLRQSQPIWIRAGAAFAVGAVAAALVLSLATGSSSPTVWSAHVVSKLTELAALPTAASAGPTAAPQIASAAPPTPATTIAPVPAATPEPSKDSGRDRHEGGGLSGSGSGH